jgi:hypothetical protein
MKRGSRTLVETQKKSPEKNPKSARKRANPEPEPQNAVAVVGADESTLVGAERKWLEGRLVVGLEKTRSVLAVIENDSLADNDEFDQLLEMQSLEEVLAALNAKGNNKKKKGCDESVAAMVFRSVFSDEEWSELEKSDQVIANATESELRMLRLERQRKLLWETRSVAIDLTVRDDALAAQQTAAVNESMQVLSALLVAVGMNARGTMKRNVVASPARAPAAQRQQKKEPTAGKVKSKTPTKKKTKGKKRTERNEEQEEEDVGDEEERDNSAAAKKKAKASEVEEEVDDEQVEENEEQENDDEAEENEEQENDDDELEMEEVELDISDLLEKAKLDFEVVKKMLSERDKQGGLVIKVSNVKVPDPSFASAEAGALLLNDEQKLCQCLVEVVEGDDWLSVERWGTLLKWWRLVNRAFSIAGIFASLKTDGDGRTLKDKYNKLLPKREKAYSYSQACVYDRLGRFLIKFPRFVFQLQLVSLKDWLQNVDSGDESDSGNTKLIKHLEEILDADDEGTFWKQPVQVDNIEPVAVASAVASAGPGAVGSSSVPDPVGSSVAAVVVAPNSAENNDEGTCYVCKIVKAGSHVWQCSRCEETYFHEACVGYADGTVCHDIGVPGEIELETLVYCKECLAEEELTVEDVGKGIAEAKAVGKFLNAAECEFKLKKIEEDGYCCFRILEEVAREKLSWRKGAPEFCRQVAKFAVKSAEVAGALEADTLKDLNALVDEKKPVEKLKKGFWKRLDVQHILKGFVEMFKEKNVVVNVYQSRGGGGGVEGSEGNVRKTDTYGEVEEGGVNVVVNVLQWNVTQHFDCLVKK